MSQENVELTYQAIDAFNRRDLGALESFAVFPDLRAAPFAIRPPSVCHPIG
jgi:hypothetical protein